MKTLLIANKTDIAEIMELIGKGFLKSFKPEIISIIGGDDLNQVPALMNVHHNLVLNGNHDNANTIELIINLAGIELTSEILNQYIDFQPVVIDEKIYDALLRQFNEKNELKSNHSGLFDLESELENEKKFLNSLFDSMKDIVIVVDNELEIVRANNTFYNYTNTTQEESIGKKCYNIFSQTDLCTSFRNHPELFETVINSKLPYSKIIVTELPRETHWEMTVTPITDKENNIEYFLIIWHKITEKVLLEREIEMAEKRFTSLINSAQDWISMKDTEGRYVVVNPATAKAFDLSPEDFIGKKPEELLIPEIVKIIKENDNIALTTRKAHTFHEILNLKGKEHHFQMVRFPLNDWRGEIFGICTIGRDVTNEILLQQQLFQSEKLAALGKLSAGLAHEINNPLAGILANAEYIQENLPRSSDLFEEVGTIISETLRCRDIVKLLLDFSRQDTPKLQEYYVNPIIENSIRLISRLKQFQEINLSVVNDIPNLKIIADAKQVEQVLLNLYINAADAMRNKGTITIKTDINNSGDTCLINVRDTGPGIPEHLKEQIFEPFFSTKKTNGLGLAVCQGIMDRHKGKITLENSGEKGASFIIQLPAIK